MTFPALKRNAGKVQNQEWGLLWEQQQRPLWITGGEVPYLPATPRNDIQPWGLIGLSTKQTHAVFENERCGAAWSEIIMHHLEAVYFTLSELCALTHLRDSSTSILINCRLRAKLREMTGAGWHIPDIAYEPISLFQFCWHKREALHSHLYILMHISWTEGIH